MHWALVCVDPRRGAIGCAIVVHDASHWQAHESGAATTAGRVCCNDGTVIITRAVTSSGRLAVVEGAVTLTVRLAVRIPSSGVDAALKVAVGARWHQRCVA